MGIREHSHGERWVEERLARLTPPRSWEPHRARNRARLTEQLLRKRSHRGGWWIVAGATMCVVLFSLAEMPVMRAVAQRCGEWLLAASTSNRATARASLPELAMADAQGREVTLSPLKGNVVLLTFWTTTCGQCQTEMSWFTDFQDTYRDRHLVVLGVALDRDGWTQVTPHLAQQAVNYRVVVGDRERVQSAVGAAIPTTLILDREGRVAVRHVGLCSKAEYRRDIEKLLNE
jgi:peroxiredoxin